MRPQAESAAARLPACVCHVATFADKPTLRGDRVVLRPTVADDAAHMWADLHDEEAIRLTGTHRTVERPQIDE